MRKLSISCILLVLALLAYSQNINIDSFEAAIKPLRGKSKVKAMNEMAMLLSNKFPTKAETIANAAYHGAKRIGDWRGMALACDNLGNIHLGRNHFLPALESFHQSLSIRKQARDDVGQAQSTLQISRVYFLFGDADHAERTLLDALTQAKKAKWTIGIGLIEDELGHIYFTQNAYNDAMLQFKAAWSIWERQLDAPKLAKTAAQIGKTARMTGDLAQAESYLEKAVSMGKNVQDSKWLASLHLELAKVFLAKNELNLAGHHNQLSFDNNLKNANTLGLAENHLAFGEIALRQGDKALSLDRFERAKNLLEHKEPSAEMIEVLNLLSQGFQALGETDIAFQTKRFSLESKREMDEKKLKDGQRLMHELLVASVNNLDQAKKIELLETMSANDRRIRVLMYFLLGLAGFLAALVYIFYKRNMSDGSQLFAQHIEIVKRKEDQEEMNKELGMKNVSLELLNKKLVEEIAERENIERSSFARDRYLATMSHEMRTPLNVIVGLTHLLMDANPRLDQVERLRTLQFSANELVVFINDVLDFSKIEAGKLDLQSREFDLGIISNNVFENFEKKTVEKGLHFYYSFDTRIPRRLIGDDSRFFQVLSNLLNNCLDSTKEGMIRAEISLEEQKERDLIVRIEVEASDGGEIRNFNGLLRLNDEDSASEVTPKQLSLAITKRLVELQHGRLEIENIYEEASRFTVLLPFKKAFPVQNNIIQLDLTDYSQLQGARVLVVEDNKINQVVVAKILTRNGMEVHTADNGFEAIELVETNNFDLILMDIQMPEMDGYRATAEIRNNPSSLKQNIPIIALTSSAFLTEKEKAVLFGMNDYVGKPFSPDELLEKIIGCLQVNKKC